MASSPKIVSKKIIWIRIAENVCVCVCVCALEIIIIQKAEFHINSCECVPVSISSPLPNVTWIWIICICAGVWDLSSRNTMLPTLMWILQEKCSFHFIFLGLATLLPQNKKNKNDRPIALPPSWYHMCFFIPLSHCLYLSNFPPIHKFLHEYEIYILHTHTHTHTCV